MPDELELLEIELKQYELWIDWQYENAAITKEDRQGRKIAIADFKVMISKVREQIKDFEDTVSGSGG